MQEIPCYTFCMIQKITHVEKEFLLSAAARAALPFRLHGTSGMVQALLQNIQPSALEMVFRSRPGDGGFPPPEPVTAYFAYGGQTYTFRSRVRKRTETGLLLDMPEFLYKSLRRKFVRVCRPKGLQVVFALDNEEIRMDYPVCPEYSNVEEPADINISTDIPIQRLIAAFREELSGKCTANSIRMFRTKKPERLEEILVSETGKVLFIPSTSSGLPRTDPYPEGRLITEAMEEQFEDPNFLVEESALQKLLAEKKAEGITSEIWCPVVFYQYVVGYIYAANKGRSSFDFSMIDTLWDFSRILAYKLKEVGYFAAEQTTGAAKEHSAKIVDMTPEGILIAVPENELRIPVKEGAGFRVTVLPEEGGAVSAYARVCRRHTDQGTTYYGAQFAGMKAEDRMRLFTLLYGSKNPENDPSVFEKSGTTAAAPF